MRAKAAGNSDSLRPTAVAPLLDSTLVLHEFSPSPVYPLPELRTTTKSASRRAQSLPLSFVGQALE